MPRPDTTRIAQVGKFGVVGIINTLIDFVGYNIFSGAGLSLVQANLLSTSIAMGFSFAANKKVVFQKHHGSVARQAALFIVITAFGLYILQTGTIKLLTDVWLAPLAFVLGVAHAFGISGHDQFIIKNGAKALGSVISLTWNYVMYKKVVFA
ncbi:MAG TPA: GtrA family protein [Candidatus Saccharimonadia bacterium]|jgi:putative flippase GtrA|nr:GtrA family protein [Candidatus Saccharimonadia bacterium]